MNPTTFESPLLREHYTRIDHKSGLPIYVFPKPFATTYAILATRYGSTDVCFSPAGDGSFLTVPDGVAHFLEHKLFDNPDGSDAMARFSALGADANAYTDYRRTAYLFSCTEHFDESLEELLRFVYSPYFTDASVKKEQGIIAEEIRMYDDSPWDRCLQQLLEGMYAKNPVRRNVCGTAESISRITPDLLMTCYRTFYQPSNMALVVCGNVTPEEVAAVADKVLPHAVPARPILRREPEEPREVAKSFAELTMQVAKPIFTIGFKDPDIPADPTARMRRDAAVSLLGEVIFSRAEPFFSNLFESGKLTASYSYGYSICDSFAFFCVSGESDRPEEIRDVLLDSVARLRETGIDPAVFERCRRILLADSVRAFDSTEEIANDLLSFVFDGVNLFDYPTVLSAVSLTEVSDLLSSLFRPENLSLSVVKG